ncbi:MAG TPA: hypothetical protein VII06_30970 [Chloroflexota bacterium]|jgi:hypothetical protein
MTTPLVRLAEVAHIAQGMGLTGRAAGAREGNWAVRVASVGDIQDDRLRVDALEARQIDRNVKTEKHLLQPDDVLVTARSSAYKAALVPPSETHTVADATLLVVRSKQPDLGPYLWWYLTAPPGREQALARMTSVGVPALTAASLGELELPLPGPAELRHLTMLIETTEQAYAAAMEAAHLRRTLYRDAIVARLLARTAHGESE